VGVEGNEPIPLYRYLSIRWDCCKLNCYELVPNYWNLFDCIWLRCVMQLFRLQNYDIFLKLPNIE